MRAEVLLTLCTAVSLVHDATMARLPQIQDPNVVAPMIQDDDQFYRHGDHECKKCPPGTFVHKPCSRSRTEGVCEPCENGTFYNLPNSFPYCFSCRACRILDEVEIKKCTATTNTECACKDGSFCSPGQPCETCIKCSPSCGPGEKKVQDCTPTSNIQCLPDTTSSPPTGSPEQGAHGRVWPYVLGVLAVVLLGLVLGLCWKYRTTFINACTNFWSSKPTQFLQYLQRKSSAEPSEERDSMQREQRPKIILPSLSTTNRQVLETMIPLSNSPPEEERQERAETRKLVPANCNNPAETLRQSFDVFISKVPTKNWKRFMRLLKLTDNEIDSAEVSLSCKDDQYYQMLRTWLEKNGQEATLSVLLDALNGMELKGVVQEVTSALISQDLYVYKE